MCTTNASIPKPQDFCKSLLSSILHKNNMPTMLFYTKGERRYG